MKGQPHSWCIILSVVTDALAPAPGRTKGAELDKVGAWSLSLAAYLTAVGLVRAQCDTLYSG